MEISQNNWTFLKSIVYLQFTSNYLLPTHLQIFKNTIPSNSCPKNCVSIKTIIVCFFKNYLTTFPPYYYCSVITLKLFSFSKSSNWTHRGIHPCHTDRTDHLTNYCQEYQRHIQDMKCYCYARLLLACVIRGCTRHIQIQVIMLSSAIGSRTLILFLDAQNVVYHK